MAEISIFRYDRKPHKIWQGRQDLNLQHPVLETGTLPVELHPCIFAPVESISAIPNPMRA